jgi:hypothetical protein
MRRDEVIVSNGRYQWSLIGNCSHHRADGFESLIIDGICDAE